MEDEGYSVTDVVEIGDTKLKGLRTFILTLIALLGFIGLIFGQAVYGFEVDPKALNDLYYLTGIAFGSFFVKSLFDINKK